MRICVRLLTQATYFEVDFNDIKGSLLARQPELSELIRDSSKADAYIHDLLRLNFSNSSLKGKEDTPKIQCAFMEIYYLLRPAAFLSENVEVDLLEIIDLLPNNDGNSLLRLLVDDPTLPIKHISFMAANRVFTSYYRALDLNEERTKESLTIFLSHHLGVQEIQDINGTKLAELIVELSTSGKIADEDLLVRSGMEALYHHTFPEDTLNGHVTINLNKLHDFWDDSESHKTYAH